jgi:hypothetical protein
MLDARRMKSFSKLIRERRLNSETLAEKKAPGTRASAS